MGRNGDVEYGKMGRFWTKVFENNVIIDLDGDANWGSLLGNGHWSRHTVEGQVWWRTDGHI